MYQYRIFLQYEAEEYLSKSSFAILRFHFDPFLLPKTELFFISVHAAQFSDRDGYLDWGSRLSSETHLFHGFFYIGSVGSVLKLFRFWCSHYRVSFLFSSVFNIVFI